MISYETLTIQPISFYQTLQEKGIVYCDRKGELDWNITCAKFAQVQIVDI